MTGLAWHAACIRSEAAASYARLAGLQPELAAACSIGASWDAASEVGIREAPLPVAEPLHDAAPWPGAASNFVQPHRFSTAILSRSSAFNDAAFLSSLCFLRRSFLACVFTSCTLFCAAFMAAAASRMALSKSIAGFLALFVFTGRLLACAGGSAEVCGFACEDAAAVAGASGTAASAAAQVSLPWNTAHASRATIIINTERTAMLVTICPLLCLHRCCCSKCP